MNNDAENELPPYVSPEILDSIPTLRVSCDGKIHRFRCFSAGFINEWRKEKNALSTEELALKASSYLFYEQNRATSWQSESYLNFPKEYRYYGLESLSDLFGVVVRKHLRANRASHSANPVSCFQAALVPSPRRYVVSLIGKKHFG